jgi:hypothetical protein
MVAITGALVLFFSDIRSGGRSWRGISVKFADVECVELNILRVTDEGVDKVRTSSKARGEVR